MIHEREQVVVEQRTPEWFAARKGRLGASQFPAILGENKRAPGYPQTYGVWEEMTGLAESRPPNAAMQRGIALEDALRGEVARHLQTPFAPTCFAAVLDSAVPLWASLDGWDGERVLEIKVLGEEAHRIVRLGSVPPWYRAQVQGQLAITGAEEAVFASYHEATGHLFILKVARDTAWIDEHGPALTAFWQAVQRRTPIGDPDAEYGAITPVDSASLLAAGQRYAALKQRLEEAYTIAGVTPQEVEAQADALKAAVRAAGRGKYQVGPILASVVERQGGIDYSAPAIAERLVGLNLDEYRKPPILAVTLKEA